MKIRKIETKEEWLKAIIDGGKGVNELPVVRIEQVQVGLRND